MWVLVGLIPGLSWGCLPPTSKRIGGRPECQTLGICLTTFLLGIIILIINIFTSTSPLDYFITSEGMISFFVAIISGLCWFVGGLFQMMAIKYSSVSRTMPISSSLQLITVSIFSSIIFQTWLKKPEWQFPIGLSLILLITIGVVLSSMDKKIINVKTIDGKSTKNNTLFIISIAISTLGFFLYAIIPQSISYFFSNPNVNCFDQGNMFPQALGMLLAASLYVTCKFLYNKKNNNPQLYAFCDKYTYLNMITGCFQAIGNLFFFVAIAKLGTVYASPLSQTGVVYSTLLGFFWLKEKKVHPYDYISYAGLVLIVTGALILGYMDVILGLN